MSDPNPRGSIKLPSDFFFREVPPETKGGPPNPAARAPWSTCRICWRFCRERLQHHLPARQRCHANAATKSSSSSSAPSRQHSGTEPHLRAALVFKSLGSVPNRGTTPQGDIFLNGVPYLQTINDITVHGENVGIHFEPGMWIHVPATTVPPIARSNGRPHGLHPARDYDRGPRHHCHRRRAADHRRR